MSCWRRATHKRRLAWAQGPESPVFSSPAPPPDTSTGVSPPLKVPPTAQRAIHEVELYLEAHPDSAPTACLCGGADDIPLTETDRHGLPCALRLCRDCGLIRMDPQPTDETLAWFYEHAYRSIYGPHIDDLAALFESKAWKGRFVESGLRRAGLELRAGPIVDLGCGGGWVLEYLQRLQHPTVGYDYDERLLELGRERGLALRHGGIAEAAHDGVRAELLILAHVLEHTKDPVRHLRSLHSLVIPGGWLYLEVPHTERIGSTLRGQSSLYWQRAHLWDFQRPHLEAVAKRAGWRPIYSGEDHLSVQLLCSATDPEPDCPIPQIGRDVQAQLASHERLRRSPVTRARSLVHAAARWVRRCQRAFQPRW